MQAKTAIQKNQDTLEPKSAHSTVVAAQYVEQRRTKAETQRGAERSINKFMPNNWKKREYVIL